MRYYRTEKINDHITAIRSLTGEIVYLIEGSEKAALIDTCLGVGHLRGLVESLTDKPVTVLLTHGHLDHAPGAPEFDTVYMNEKDIPLYKEHCAVEGRLRYMTANPQVRVDLLTPEDFVPPCPDYAFRALEDGMVFDLGGVHVDAFAFPGHTWGSMVFLIREDRILITGDACNTSTFLFDEKYSASVEAYRDACIRVRDRLRGAYDRVFICHVVTDVKTDLLDSMIGLCEDIMAGRADDVPFEFLGMRAWRAKATDGPVRRSDGGTANVIYSKQHIFRRPGEE